MLDLEILARWMDDQGLPGGPISDVERLSGGTQNVLIKFTRGDRSYVVRRPPEHPRPKSNEILRREARVLAALAGTDVPHPRLIAACPDESVLGDAVFYLMEPVDGFNPATTVPARHAGDAATRHEMGLQAAEAAARLGSVDHHVAGLGDFGRPDGFIQRQVGRWMSELDSYGELAGYPGPDIPGVHDIAAWLEANQPASWQPGIMHGDYHLANLMYAFDGPRLAAIVDWEMCTIGDPLLDLGTLLATWPDADDPGPLPWGALAGLGGLPGPLELIARYADHSSRDLSGISWYVVLACFRLGIVLEGTHARAFAGKAPKAVGDLLHTITLKLFERALVATQGG